MIKFCSAGRLPPSLHWQMPMHHHTSFHEIIVVARGEIHTEIRGQTLIGVPGHVLLYPKNEPHTESAAGRVPLETFFFGFDEPEMNLNSWPLLLHDRAGHVLHLAQWLMELFGRDGPADRKQAGRLIESILHELYHQHVSETPITRVIRHIQYHLAEPLTLDDLAEVAGMSRFHFARSFTETVGQSPMQFLRQRRVEAARHFLKTSTLPLRAIAPQVGLVDEAHLSRVFRRVTGQSPGQVRST